MKKYGKEVRGKDSNREKSPTSGCACVYPREPRMGHVTSGRPLGHAQWYYYNSSSTKCTGCACARDHHLAPPSQIRLCNHIYTTHIQQYYSYIMAVCT